jgi:hypothetical protein
MCGIVVSVAMKGTDGTATNTIKKKDVWKTLVRLNTPRGAPRVTFVPDPAFLLPFETTD